MANTLQLYLTCIRNTLEAAMCLQAIRLMDDVEELFVRHFAKGDKRKAKKYLKPNQREESHTTTLFIGNSFYNLCIPSSANFRIFMHNCQIFRTIYWWLCSIIHRLLYHGAHRWDVHSAIEQGLHVHILSCPEKNGPGAPGGQSWTAEWLKFDNNYFNEIKEKRDQDLLVLPTDAALFEDPAFKVYAEKYAEDQEAFFKDYAEAHAKLSNLGAKFNPPEGFSLDD